MKLEKGTTIVIDRNDKKFEVVHKESYGDMAKIDFLYEGEMYAGVILTITSIGNYRVGVLGKLDEEGIENG